MLHVPDIPFGELEAFVVKLAALAATAITAYQLIKHKLGK